MSSLTVITDFREGEEGVISSIDGGSGLTSRLAGIIFVEVATFNK